MFAKKGLPGGVVHGIDIVKHPQAIADRLVRYAKIVGRENVMGGTDCGLGLRVGDPQIAWRSSKRWPKAHG